MATLTSSLAIGYVNRASGRTITASTAATGYPALSLSNPRLSSSWRSTIGSLNAQDLIADLGSSQNIDVIALIGSNGSDEGATRRNRTSENSNLSSPEYDESGNIWDATTYPSIISDVPKVGRNIIDFTTNTVNSRYVGIQLTDTSNVNNYLSGRVFWAGPIWQPITSFSLQGESFRIRYEIIGEPGIERFIRHLEIDLHVLTEGEARALESVCLNRLGTGRLLVIPRPTQVATFLSEALYCTLEELPMRTSWAQGGGLSFWKVQLKFRECED